MDPAGARGGHSALGGAKDPSDFPMKCDTCHREVLEVSRVVIYLGYNKVAAKAVYNCPECFSQKEKTKAYNKSQESRQKKEDP